MAAKNTIVDEDHGKLIIVGENTLNVETGLSNGREGGEKQGESRECETHIGCKWYVLEGVRYQKLYYIGLGEKAHSVC